MLFFEAQFIFGFLLFFVAYLYAPLRTKHVMIVIASYIFYSFWDWRFLSLLIISTLTDYLCAIAIEKHPQGDKRRKQLLWLSVGINLGILGFFKYCNFFISSAADLLNLLGMHTNPVLLNIILPAGISFYTFQTLCYTIDVYKGQIKAERDPVVFAAYVSFFPQLVAGPIERASHLLPRIRQPEKVTVERVLVGLRLFMWGFFKKIYVADNLAVTVDYAFANPGGYSSLMLVLASWAFAFQIYCDFSGYSDMARGLGKMLGIDLQVNFNLPYFSRSIREFWKRWHISLSTWLRDYVYIPLGGNRGTRYDTVRNLMVTMGLSGLWHGAGWHFILWGIGHGVLLSLEFLLKRSRMTALWHKSPGLLRAFVTFNIVCLLWILFRSPDMAIALKYYGSLFSNFDKVLAVSKLAGLESPGNFLISIYQAMRTVDRQHLFQVGCYLLPLLVMEYIQLKKHDHLVDIGWPLPVKILVYAFFILLIVMFGTSDGKQFIYFQF